MEIQVFGYVPKVIRIWQAARVFNFISRPIRELVVTMRACAVQPASPDSPEDWKVLRERIGQILKRSTLNTTVGPIPVGYAMLIALESMCDTVLLLFEGKADAAQVKMSEFIGLVIQVVRLSAERRREENTLGGQRRRWVSTEDQAVMQAAKQLACAGAEIIVKADIQAPRSI